MMNNTNDNITQIDLRIRRTHKLLVEAFLNLLTEKPYDEIHITHICEKAMVHRTTFYKHFNDKSDLLFFSLSQLETAFYNQILKQEYAVGTIKNDNFRDIILNVMHFIEQNKKIFIVGLEKLKNGTIRNIVHETLVVMVKDIFYKNIENGQSYSIPISVIAEFYCGALMSLASWWMNHDLMPSADTMTEYINILISRDALCFLEN